MGKLVSVVGMSHNPTYYWNKLPPGVNPAPLHKSFDELKRRLNESSPDVIIVVANDHISNFFFDNMPAFCVGVSEEAEGPASYEEELGVPHYKATVKKDVGTTLLKAGYKDGFNFAWSNEYLIDHAFTVPLSILVPQAGIPIVPVFTNGLAPPTPHPREFYTLGKIISKTVESFPKDLKVGVVGSFNLSLELGGPKSQEPDFEFDKTVMSLVGEGKGSEVVSRFNIERVWKAGNTTGEFLNLNTLLGVVGDRKPSFIDSKFLPNWFGWNLVAWDV
jgi:protocatechuate 4,5-dioxygenase, beta chain